MKHADTSKKNKDTTLTERPPVVVILGHIDHGKSSLLDYIRKSNIVAGEAGGITQHMGSYEVVHKNEQGKHKKITFLDTPGHAAFSHMRKRGAGAADIAILIISAEEGMKAQSEEALNAITEAQIPYIIALTKIDKPNANLDRVKQDLANHNIFIEGYGGQIPCVPVSSKTGEGVPELLDMILLLAEINEYKANEHCGATGIIIESSLDQKRGVSTTLLIKNGILSQGDYIVIDNELSPVRLIEDFSGKKIASATFSAPVKIMGLKIAPQAGAHFEVCASKKDAQELLKKDIEITSDKKAEVITEQQIILPIILKADFLGTLEAIEAALRNISTTNVFVYIVHTGIGTIGESDMKAAESSVNPLVIGFNVKVDKSAQSIVDKTGIHPQLFTIIYEITDYVEQEIRLRTPRVSIETLIGKAKILKTFGRTKEKQIIGGTVVEGNIIDGKDVKLIRQNTEVARGLIVGLQQQKIKVKEVPADTQFGAMVECRLEIAPGDYLEVFDTVTQ